MMDGPFRDRGNDVPFRGAERPTESAPSRARQADFSHPGLTDELDALLEAYSPRPEDDPNATHEERTAELRRLEVKIYELTDDLGRIRAWNRANPKDPLRRTPALVEDELFLLKKRVQTLKDQTRPRYRRATV